MNFKTTLVLLGLLIVIGVFYGIFYFAGWEGVSPEEARRIGQDPQPLLELEQREALRAVYVQRIELELPDQKYELVRTPEGDWEQVAPSWFPLKRWSIRPLIDEAATLTKQGEAFRAGRGDAPSLQELGLDPPRAVIRYHIEPDEQAIKAAEEGSADAPQVEAQTISLKLGRKTPGGPRGYAMLGQNDDVYRVSNELHQRVLEDGIESWRSRSLAAPTSSVAESVTLTHAGQTATMSRRQGQWWFEPPMHGRASGKAVQGLLTGVNTMQIKQFVAEDPQSLSIYGLKSPTTMLTIEQPAQSPLAAAGQAQEQQGQQEQAEPDQEEPGTNLLTVAVGAPTDLTEEQYFASVSDDRQPGRLVFATDKLGVGQIQRSIDQLRDPKVCLTQPKHVKKAVIRRSGRFSPEGSAPVELVLARTSDGWAFAGDSPPGFAPDTDRVNELFRQLSEANAVGYRPETRPEQAEPLITMTLERVGYDEAETIRFYDPPSEADEDGASAGDEQQTPDGPRRLLAYRNQEEVGYLLKLEALERLTGPIYELRNRRLMGFKSKELTRIEIQRPEDGPSFTLVYGQATETEADVDEPPKPSQVNEGAEPTDEGTEPAKEAVTENPQTQPTDGDAKADAASEAEPDAGTQAQTQPAASPDRWRLLGDAALDQKALEELLEALKTVRAEAWVSGETLSEQTGDADPPFGLVLRISPKQGEQRTLKIDPQTNLATADGIEQPFRLPEDFVDAVDAELRPKIVLDLASDKIRGLRIEAPFQPTVHLKRQGKQFVAEEDVLIDQSAAGGLLDTLGGLKAKRLLESAPAGEVRTERSFVLELADGSRRELVIGRTRQRPRVGKVVTGQRTQWFTLDSDSFEKLNKELIGDATK